MNNPPEQHCNQSPESIPSSRLIFEESKGWYEYGRIPYKIYYVFDYPTYDSAAFRINEKKPGIAMLTEDTGGGGCSLSIFVHVSVPPEFKDIIFFHECRESELRFADNIDKDQAHQQAVVETEEYAKKHLSKEEFEKYMKWHSTLDHNQV
jgi:hypothetical protein